MDDPQFCILQQNTHQDRYIVSIYGPYSEQDAERIATEMYNSRSNYNTAYCTHYCDFHVRMMIP